MIVRYSYDMSASIAPVSELFALAACIRMLYHGVLLTGKVYLASDLRQVSV
jgi:hypothetical protein